MSTEKFDINEIVKASMGDPNIEGLYRDADGRLVLDRRYTAEAIGQLGLSPRTADLGLIGPDRLLVPEELQSLAEAQFQSRDQPTT